MAKDLAVILEDRPGRLADLGQTLGMAGVNIEGLCGAPAGGGALMHVLVEDAAAARRALDAAKIRVYEERDVLVLETRDEPDELGRLCRKMAEAGVNIELVYLATHTRVVLGVDKMEAAQAALGGSND